MINLRIRKIVQISTKSGKTVPEGPPGLALKIIYNQTLEHKLKSCERHFQNHIA